MMRLTTLFTCLLALASAALVGQQRVVVGDGDLDGNQTYNWTSDTEYVLDGLVYLESGGVLNIEAGTVIRGLAETDITSGDQSSALIISRGAQIFARGTADEPIVFTADADDLTNQSNDDPTAQDRGLWGGLIILGDAPIGFSSDENGIEGIDADEPRAKYGGDDADDNSGVLNYVSIRHGGFALSGGDEINGLTLGGVGSGTEIDYVEVFANSDDGIEWFGGTVSVKHASVAFCGDDAFDYDLGWRGNGQFWFALQEPSNPDGTGRAGEHDGAIPDAATPFSQPTIYNATYIGVGNGEDADDGDASDDLTFAVLFRDNAGGYYNNSIFTGYNGAAIAIEERDDETPDSYDRFLAGDLGFSNNLFEDFENDEIFLVVDPSRAEIESRTDDFAAALTAEDNVTGTSGIAGIGRTPDGMLDPRVNAGSPALAGGIPSDDDFFLGVSYRGAFGNSFNWLEGWTALDNMGYIGDLVEEQDNSAANCVVISDDDLATGQDYTWSSDSCYVLNGLVYLEEDATLNIGPGTIIRGQATNDITSGDNTSALIIARGAQIFARGTQTEPIIFTAAVDDLDNVSNDDPTPQDRGLWGGLIILGDAPIAFSSDENGIEGIDADEDRAKYGGDNPEDNSGVLNYVSIRHGGFALSGGDEINGLTLGGVGSGTEIDYVEVFANSDDGIEWFGGTVRVDHASVAYCGDDAFDYDLGWRGGGQFWFAIQEPTNPDGTGRAGEHDGAIPDAAMPFSNPSIYNATYIGVGNGEDVDDGDASDDLTFAVLFRDNAAGSYRNSIFTDYNGAAIAIEQRDDETPDSYDRLVAGELVFENNIFFNFEAGDDPSDLFLAVDPSRAKLDAATDVVVANFAAANNRVIDPSLNDVEDRNGTIDPRPNEFGIASFGAGPVEAGYEEVSYFGAFAPASGLANPNWLAGWTALSEEMIVDDILNSVGQAEANGYLLDAPQPNPAVTMTTVKFELPNAGQVTMLITDLSGRPLAKRSRRYSAGQQFETIDVSSIPAGVYFITLDTEGGRLVQKMVVGQ